MVSCVLGSVIHVYTYTFLELVIQITHKYQLATKLKKKYVEWKFMLVLQLEDLIDYGCVALAHTTSHHSHSLVYCLQVDLTCHLSCSVDSSRSRQWPTSICHCLGSHPFSIEGSSKQCMDWIANKIHFVIVCLCQKGRNSDYIHGYWMDSENYSCTIG